MSRSQLVQDYTGFAAKVNSEKGIARQDFRLNAPKIVRLLLVCLFSLVISSNTFAQWPAGMGWDQNNQGVGTLQTGGGVLSPGAGAVDGRPSTVTNNVRMGSWTIRDYYPDGIGGSLSFDGGRSVHHLNFLDIQNNLSVNSASRVYNISQVIVGGNVTNYGGIDNITTVDVQGNVTNGPGAHIGTNSNDGWIYSLTVGGTLTNHAQGMNDNNESRPRAEIINVNEIKAGVLDNRGLIQKTLYGGLWSSEEWMSMSIETGTLINGNNVRLNQNGSPRERRDAEIISDWYISIDVSGNFTQYFDGSVRAREGTLNVGGTLYNAGEIRMSTRRSRGMGGVGENGLVVGEDWWYDLTYNHGWTISAYNLINDGRTWEQWTDGVYPRSGTTRTGVDSDTRQGGSDSYLGGWGIIYDAIQLTVRGDLTSMGANAVINGSVDTHDGSFMHVGGDLRNLDRASIFNYQEVIVHGDFENRGATFVGGSWFRHSYLTTNNEYPRQSPPAGLINIGGNVVNYSEKAHGGETYGGLIASFDRFNVYGSLVNDANSMITGTYAHYEDRDGDGNVIGTTAPLEYGYNIVTINIDPVTGNETPVFQNNRNDRRVVPIYGRRASILNGVLSEGNDYRTAATVLNVMGLKPYSLSSGKAILGLYNQGHIREIDIINVGSNEDGVLWNAFATLAPGATLPTSDGGSHEEYYYASEPNRQINLRRYIGIPGMITDVGVINATNLINQGTISKIDVAINVSYALFNDFYDETIERYDPDTLEGRNGSNPGGILDGLSTSHIEWTYNPDGTLDRIVVLTPTRADLRVGKAGENNPLETVLGATYLETLLERAGLENVGIVNLGLIQNFEHVTSLGDMYNFGTFDDSGRSVISGIIENVTLVTVGSNMVDKSLADGGTRASLYNSGILTNVNGVDVSWDLHLNSGSSFGDVGTITAYNDVNVNGSVDGGFGVLSARKGKLTVGSPTLPGMSGGYYSSGSLTIDRGSVASGHGVVNWGDITNYGLLSSETTILNEGEIFSTGTINSFNDFVNYGGISGGGLVFIAGQGNQFRNEAYNPNTPQVGGKIVGGLAVNGHFLNYGGLIKLTDPKDVIRVTNGTATIIGGWVDASIYSNAVVGGQYPFLTTDIAIGNSLGNLVILKELKAVGSGSTGSVLDFAPMYGSWDGTRYVPGQLWSRNNQFYWLEVQRAYTYGNYAETPNQIAVGEYIDKIGATVKQDSSVPNFLGIGGYTKTGLWNLLAQLDGISDDQTNPLYDPNYSDHQGPINPKALRALDELSGAIYGTIGITSVHNTGVVNMTLADTLRSDVFKFSFVGNPNNAIRGQAIAPLRYTRWGTLFGIGGTSQHDGNADGYKTSFGGLMAGIDRAFWTGTRVGAYLSVAGGQITLKDLDERTESVDVMVGMYLRQEMYYGYGLVAAGFGQDTYKTKRNLTSLRHRAESKMHGTIGSLYMERGMDIPVYYATVQPFTSFQVVSVHQDKFTETMWNQYGYYTNIGLEGVKGRTDSFKLGLGARASSQPVPLPWGQLALSANMAWYHDFQGKNDRDFIARFSNPGGNNFDSSLSDVTFRVYGNNPKQDWFNFGWGLHLDRNSTRFFLDANLYANERQTMFTGNGGIVTSW